VSRRRAARAALALGGLAVLVACAAPRPPIQLVPERALFWEVRGGERDATLYLLGSVHVGDGRPLVLDARLAEAFASAEELVVEVDLAEITPERVMRFLGERGMLPPGEELSQRLSAETLALLGDFVAQHHLEAALVERLEPWALSLVVIEGSLREAGYEGAYGVDQWFLARAKESGKAVVGLETVEFQLGLLAGLSPEHQERLLRESLLASAPGGGLDQVESILDAWERGDAAALERLAHADLSEDPSLAPFFEATYFARNESMRDALVRLMADGRTRFCVVGSGHLVGARGIPALLAAEGHRVTGPGLPLAAVE
jgi:uncharacterized protein YbaP (TraB family)